MTQNGIDIDQYLLLTLYPATIIFGLGFAGKKKKIRQSLTFLVQGLICIGFSAAYFVVIPNGGADGLAIVLALFGVLLLFVARKHIIHPEEEEQEEQKSQRTSNSNL